MCPKLGAGGGMPSGISVALPEANQAGKWPGGNSCSPMQWGFEGGQKSGLAHRLDLGESQPPP